MKRPERLPKPKLYVVWHPDDAVRLSSSSGGAFSLLAESVLARGGIVFGAVWNDRNEVVVEAVDSPAGLARIRESKYVTVVPGDEYRLAKRQLESGRPVLYSGTPCQIAGLYAFLGGDDPNLTTVDVVCHGAPDMRVWRKYVAYLESKYRDRLDDIHFRDKRWGVECNLLLTFRLHSSGRRVIVAGRENTYYNGFIKNYFLRPCCRHCRFNAFPRQADLSLADFRGLGDRIPFAREGERIKGFSAVFVNSEKGAGLLRNSPQESVEERPLAEMVSDLSVYAEPKEIPCDSADFWSDFERLGWKDLADRYLRVSWRSRIQVFLRRVLGPRCFLALGCFYKKLRKTRTTTWFLRG